jgi:hypothetical protein
MVELLEVPDEPKEQFSLPKMKRKGYHDVPGLYSLLTLPIPPQLLPTLNSLLLPLVLLPDAIPATDAAKDAVDAADDLRLGVVKLAADIEGRPVDCSTALFDVDDDDDDGPAYEMLRPNAALRRGVVPRPTLAVLATDATDDVDDEVEPKLRRGRFRSLLSSPSSWSVSSMRTSVSLASPRCDDATAERAAVRRLDVRGCASLVDGGTAEVVLDRRKLILVIVPAFDGVANEDEEEDADADADADADDCGNDGVAGAPGPIDPSAIEPTTTPPTQLSSSFAGGTFSFPLHSVGIGVEEQDPDPDGDGDGLRDAMAAD